MVLPRDAKLIIDATDDSRDTYIVLPRDALLTIKATNDSSDKYPWKRKYQTSKRFIIFIGTKGSNNSQFNPEM